MSEIIILSGSDYKIDNELKNLITVPFGMLDANHPSFNQEQKKKILQDKYNKKLIADGLDTGLSKLNQNGDYTYHSKQHEHVFKGFFLSLLS